MTSRPPRRRDDGPVALGLAGGGARGAYEAGVLSVLPPLWQDVEFPPGHEVVSLPGGGGLDAKADRV